MKVMKNICGVLTIYLCIGLAVCMLMVRTSNLLDDNNTFNNDHLVVINK